MADSGKLIAGIIRESINKKTSEALAALSEREGRSRVPRAALSRLSMLDEKEGASVPSDRGPSIESRGICGICRMEVVGGERGHDRMKSLEFGERYFHLKCVKTLCSELVRAR